MTEKPTPELKFELIDKESAAHWTSGVSYQSVLKRIGALEVNLQIANNKVFELKDRVWILETPQRRKAILSFLGDKAHEEHSIKYHTKAVYGDLQEMVREGLIIQTKNRNYHTMYQVVREEIKELTTCTTKGDKE